MKAVVVGVGNEFRGDDAAGLAVAEALRDRVPRGVEIVRCEDEPSRLIDAWAGADAAILVDAAACRSRPGVLHRLDAVAHRLPASLFPPSTHAFGLAETIELARAVGRLPARVLVYAIEGASFETGAGLTSAVREAVDSVAAAILDDLEELCTSAP